VIIPRGAIAASRSNEISMQPDWNRRHLHALVSHSVRRANQCAGKSAAEIALPGRSIVILALLIVILAAFRFYNGDSHKPSTTAFIVPSQTVRW
jgi:hypothetical protein